MFGKSVRPAQQLEGLAGFLDQSAGQFRIMPGLPAQLQAPGQGLICQLLVQRGFAQRLLHLRQRKELGKGGFGAVLPQQEGELAVQILVLLVFQTENSFYFLFYFSFL